MTKEKIPYLTIHGHFYQPPRENPWLEEIELQQSAAPFHDWNERINAECYNPNSVSKIVTADNKILNVVNNYEYMSYNFGPTLLSWMEEFAPLAYERVIKADINSRRIKVLVFCGGELFAEIKTVNKGFQELLTRRAFHE